MRNIADDLAKQGFVALAPDLFWRLEPGVQINGEGEADFAKAFDLYGKFDVEKGIGDIQDSIAALRGHYGAGNKIGTVGFCLGGFLAYMSSVRTDADANVGYYGVGIDGLLDEAAAERAGGGPRGVGPAPVPYVSPGLYLGAFGEHYGQHQTEVLLVDYRRYPRAHVHKSTSMCL